MRSRRAKQPYDGDRDEIDHHWEINLLDWERNKLIGLLTGTEKATPKEVEWLAKRLKDAIHRDGPPLPHASLDWRLAEREARQRGESIPDWIFDRPRPAA